MAGMFLPALAKVGAAKLPLLLRAAGITAGAAPSLMRGDLGGALVGGGLGALGTLGLGSAAGMGSKALTGAAIKGLGSKVFTPAGGALTDLARIAPALGIGALWAINKYIYPVATKAFDTAFDKLSKPNTEDVDV